MKMESKLILKKLLNLLTGEEEEIFDQWYNESSENRKYFEEERKKYLDLVPDSMDIDKTAAWENVERKLPADVPAVEQTKKQKSYWKYAIAASVVLFISLGIFFYDDVLRGNATESKIETGSSKAILTLEDGTQVPLKKGEAYTSGNVNSDGESVVYAADENVAKEISYNELTVPRGGEFLLLLADSTRVWLNSDTKIRYPNTFIDGQPRIVELRYGEAFFEVTSAEKHGGSAFRVTTRNQEIEVLGTQFNVSAYREDKAVTSTLVEGKVAVNTGNTKKELKPGEQAIVTKDDPEITVSTVDVNNYITWRNGFFGFDEKPLAEIMQTLSRWYDVEVEFENKSLQNIRFSGVLGRREPIKVLLSLISEFDRDVEFEIKGRKILVKEASSN